MLHSIFFKEENIAVVKIISLTGLLGTSASLFWLKNIYKTKIIFCNNLLQLDRYSAFCQILFSAVLLIFFLLPEKKYINKKTRTEGHVILLSLLLSCNILSMACHWLSSYVILNFISILLSVIIYNGEKEKSNSHAIQYLIYSAVSSAIALFGISYYYAVFNTLSWSPDISILEKINPEIFSALIILCISNFLFNITIFPYHFVIERKYEGTTSTDLIYISLIPPITTLLCLNRLFSIILQNTDCHFTIPLKNFLIILAIITILLGNIKAIKTKNNYIKLAYASMTNMGIICGYIILFPRLRDNLFYYIFTYSIATVGMWICITIFEKENIETSAINNKNTNQKYNYLYICFIIFLVSLIGLPPSAGFSAKLFILIDLGRLCIKSHNALNTILFISTIVSIPISLYYYLEIARSFYTKSSSFQLTISSTTSLIIMFLAILVVIGFYAPGFLYLVRIL